MRRANVLCLLAAAVVQCVLTGQAGAAVIPSINPSSPEEGHVVHLCVISDRVSELAATVKSAYGSKGPSTALRWHVVTTATKAEVLAALDGRDVHVIDYNKAVEALVDQGIDPVWMWEDWQRWLHAPDSNTSKWRTDASLRVFPLSREAKHAHPLNLLRLYLSELPELRHLDRLLLVDDDVLFQRDLWPLYDAPLAKGTLLQASCSMYHHASLGESRWLNLTNARVTYADSHFIGSIGPMAYPSCDEGVIGQGQMPCAPKSLEPLLLSLEQDINGGTGRTGRPFREQLAWNFGAALLPLDRWREQALAGRVAAWFEANSRHRLFPPDSVASGLGLPYLLFADTVGCWAEETVLDGLGYVSLDDLERSGVNGLGRYTALHFAGPSKLPLAELPDHSPASVQLATLSHLRRARSRRRLGYGYGEYMYGGVYDPLEPSPPPPSPPLSTCKTVCDLNTKPWAVKCAWVNGACAGCVECLTPPSPLPPPPPPPPPPPSPSLPPPPPPPPPPPACNPLCFKNTRPWANKCAWANGMCTGCVECLTPPSPLPPPPSPPLPPPPSLPPPACRGMCSFNSNPWANKCAWFKCAGCIECFTPPSPLPMTPPPPSPSPDVCDTVAGVICPSDQALLGPGGGSFMMRSFTDCINMCKVASECTGFSYSIQNMCVPCSTNDPALLSEVPAAAPATSHYSLICPPPSPPPLGVCKPLCNSNSNRWSNKCKWSNGSCAGCPECA